MSAHRFAVHAALLFALFVAAGSLTACGGGGDDVVEREQINDPAKQPLVADRDRENGL